MPDLSDPILFLIGLVALGSAAAFALGSSWNLKRGNDALRWLRSSLPALGERTTLQWMGTSVVKLSIVKAKQPFKDIEILVVMEPRDVPPFWLHGHLNGRRDTLIFRGHLRQPPEFEIELMDPRLWTGREALAEVDQQAWTKVALNGTDPITQTESYVALTNSTRGASYLQEWFTRATQLTPELARISIRRAGPYQFQWHSKLPKLAAVSSSEIIRLVQQIGTQASSIVKD